ncbi:hypothetical protein F8154_08270 [Alkaliphilus pronyensis]|uniref:NERD domain-containing protein n=1 Tax=Alkaliphilus pronyensis TaxID=1482732 RepID=A0A6I0FB51_9FIRM|nr:NERD domain-containing protein [Alkaliphilus pronyensis]KAB3534710.1 hypothetical protein F8154_08270 [Alkaliphilus pronyensis]
MLRSNKKINKALSAFLRDPLWLYLLGISFITFMIADESVEYMLASIFLMFSLIVIFYMYLNRAESLHKKIFMEFSSFGEEYTLLSSVTLENEGSKGYSDYIFISAKGIFNIRALDFQGVIKGFENDDVWSYMKITSLYDMAVKAIKNPIYYHQKTHNIIYDLLAKNNIRYIPIQSIIVIRDEDAEISTNSNIPIIKAKNLKKYISQYSNRQNMFSLLDEIVAIFNNETVFNYNFSGKAVGN